jgi:hypothetical protein
MNTGVQISLQRPVLNSLGEIPKNVIASEYGGFYLNLLRILHTVP